MIAGPTIFSFMDFPNPEANKADLNQKVVAFHYFPLRYVLHICVTKMKQTVMKKILYRHCSNLQLLLASPGPRYKGSPAN